MFSTVHTNALGSVAIAFGFFLQSVAGMTAIDLDAKVVASNHTPVAATLPLYAANGVEWPVARRFDGDHLLRVALPMGGIGCGSVSLSGRGELVDWEIVNRANKTMSERRRRMPLSSLAGGLFNLKNVKSAR